MMTGSTAFIAENAVLKERIAALEADLARDQAVLRTITARAEELWLELRQFRICYNGDENKPFFAPQAETNCKPCSDARSQGQEDTVERTHPKATDQVGTVSVSGADKQPISPTFQAKTGAKHE
jgi:hypothetical protein